MKRLISFAVCVCMILILCGCSKSKVTREVLDLTAMSSTMVYSEVYNMVSNPTEYLGKSVKVRGTFTSSVYDQTGKDYFYILISDATACCQQGLEFIWSGEHNYPDDYPEIGSTVETTGIFSSYDELGVTYYYLLIDNLTVLD